MSFSFSDFLAKAQSALSTIITEIKPLAGVAETVAPIVEAFVPASAPIINAVEAGAASISAIAPTAVQDTTAAISLGQKIVVDGAPAISQLEAIFDQLFHVTSTPQAIVLTPKTTAATASSGR